MGVPGYGVPVSATCFDNELCLVYLTTLFGLEHAVGGFNLKPAFEL